MINIKIVTINDMKSSSQLIGVVPKMAARAAFNTPVIGLIAKIQEYLPAMLAG